MKKVRDGLRVAVYPVQVIEDKDLSAYAKLVYIVLRSFVNPHTDQAWPSIDRIAELASVSRRTAQRAIAELEEKCYVVKSVRFDYNPDTKKARQTSNTYTLALPESDPVSDRHPTPCQTDTPPRVCETHNHINKDHNQNEDVCSVGDTVAELIDLHGARMVVQGAEIMGEERPILSAYEWREDLIAAIVRRRKTDKHLLIGAVDVWITRQQANLMNRGHYMHVKNPVAYFFNCMDEYEKCRKSVYDAI